MAKLVHPNFVRGAAGLGAARLREVCAKAGVAAGATGAKDTPEQLAATILRALTDANLFWSLIEAADLEPIGVALGLGKRAAWKTRLSHAEFERLPFYAKPSYDQDVLNALLESGPAPEPKPRAVAKGAKHAAHAKAWPELASLAAWAKLGAKDRAAVAKRLAKAAPGFAAGKPALAGPLELPRLRHAKLGVDFVAIPGGTFAMGLSPAEQRALGKLAKPAGEEAAAHAKYLATCARPVRDVKLAPFVVAIAPLTRAQLGALAADVVDEMPTDAARALGPDAARAVASAKLRLPSEAEWEWLARAGGARSWLSGDRTPAEWAELHADRDGDAHPLAVTGLGWGEWVDDGWHATYRGAPKTSAAWEPREWPTVARGGALALWPWQVGGELVLCHAASRLHDANAAHCVRLAIDLPPA